MTIRELKALLEPFHDETEIRICADGAWVDIVDILTGAEAVYVSDGSIQ